MSLEEEIQLDDIMDDIARLESGGNPTARNRNSTATGMFQFTENTWLNTIRAARPELVEGKSRSDILELRNDPDISRDMAKALARENIRHLSREDVPINASTIYMAHFAGPTAAARMWHNPDAKLKDIMSGAAVRANGGEEFGNRTASQQYARFAQRLGDNSSIPVASVSEPSSKFDPHILSSYKQLLGNPEMSDADAVKHINQKFFRDETQYQTGQRFGVDTHPAGFGGDTLLMAEMGAQGLTMGLSRELAALVGGVANAVMDSGKSLSQAYTDQRKYNRDRAETARQRMPWASFGAETLGAIGSLPFGGAAVRGAGAVGRGAAGVLGAARAGATNTLNMARTLSGAAKLGAVEGGVRGLTLSESDSAGGRLQDAAQGAAVGAALPPALAVGGKAALAAGRAALPVAEAVGQGLAGSGGAISEGFKAGLMGMEPYMVGRLIDGFRKAGDSNMAQAVREAYDAGRAALGKVNFKRNKGAKRPNVDAATEKVPITEKVPVTQKAPVTQNVSAPPTGRTSPFDNVQISDDVWDDPRLGFSKDDLSWLDNIADDIGPDDVPSGIQRADSAIVSARDVPQPPPMPPQTRPVDDSPFVPPDLTPDDVASLQAAKAARARPTLTQEELLRLQNQSRPQGVPLPVHAPDFEPTGPVPLLSDSPAIQARIVEDQVPKQLAAPRPSLEDVRSADAPAAALAPAPAQLRLGPGSSSAKDEPLAAVRPTAVDAPLEAVAQPVAPPKKVKKVPKGQKRKLTKPEDFDKALTEIAQSDGLVFVEDLWDDGARALAELYKKAKSGKQKAAIAQRLTHVDDSLIGKSKYTKAQLQEIDELVEEQFNIAGQLELWNELMR